MAERKIGTGDWWLRERLGLGIGDKMHKKGADKK